MTVEAETGAAAMMGGGATGAIASSASDPQHLAEVHDNDNDNDSDEFVTDQEPSKIESENSTDEGSDLIAAGLANMPRMQRRGAVTSNFAPFDESYHPAALHLYSPPRQRQRWDDKQILPRINWGDLFFDLFYVAAAYNTSNILAEDPSGEGLLYAAATFFSVMFVWQARVYFDGAFVTGDDLWHRLQAVIGLCAIAGAVVHIRPVSIMSKPEENYEMFAFCVAILAGRVIGTIRQIELYFFGIGDAAIKVVAVRTCIYNSISIVFLAAAAIVSGMAFYGDNDDSGDDGAYSGTSKADDSGSGSHRFLAGESEKAYGDNDDGSTNRIPIWLVFWAFIVHFGVFSFQILFCFPTNGQHKKLMVPTNVDFTIHRHGEWTMLMLGESILSILIVDVPHESGEYFATFFCALITVALIHNLHFRSQPHGADGHAMRRNKDAGIAFTWIQFVYSLALVALGAAFTIFLLFFSTDTGRRLELEPPTSQRFLAGGSESKYDQYELRERGAHLFSISLAIIFFSLDVTSLLHIGLEDSRKRCVCRESKKKNTKGYLLLLTRAVVIVVAATLSFWLEEVEQLTEAGMVLCLLQITLRVLGNKYFPEPAARGHGHGHDHEGDPYEKNDAQQQPSEEKAESINSPWQHAAKLVALVYDSDEDNSSSSNADDVDDADAKNLGSMGGSAELQA